MWDRYHYFTIFDHHDIGFAWLSVHIWYYIYQYFLLGTARPMFGQSPRLPPHLQSEGPPRQIIFCHQYQSTNMLKSSLLLLFLLHCLSDWKVNQTLEEELKGKSLQSTLSRLSIRNFKIPFLKKNIFENKISILDTI